MNSITNNINKLFIIQVISFLLIIVSYKYFIATRWTYIGLTWNFSYIKLVESILFIIITNKILPSYNNKPSYFFLNIQFLMPILPMLALYSCSDKPRIYIYMVMSAYYLLICLVKIISRFIDKNDFMPTTLSGYNYKFVNSQNPLGVDMQDKNALDDKTTREVHLVVDKPVLLKFRSQDVIHSAFLPHFRVQMNCVPGLSTQFAFTPTKTTKQMKEEEGEDFEYVLLCNKICGSAHYNMQMHFVVETQAEYDAWIASQKSISEKLLTQK